MKNKTISIIIGIIVLSLVVYLIIERDDFMAGLTGKAAVERTE